MSESSCGSLDDVGSFGRLQRHTDGQLSSRLPRALAVWIVGDQKLFEVLPLSAIVRRIGNDVVRPRLRHQKIDSGLAKTTLVEVSTANGGWPVSSRTRDM